MPIHRLETTDAELVALKPAGLPCELPRDAAADSLVRRLAHDGFHDLRLVHRLDAPACGLVVVARTAAAAAHYSAEIAARRWHKFYVARIAATAERAASLVGSHKAYLRTDGPLARVVRAGGKPSFLDILAVAPAPAHDAQADVLIRLHTGRFHQVRAMLAHLGAPLVADVRYGGPPAAAMYLEHVMLAARPWAAAGYRLWMAPRHVDRPAWHVDLETAVHRQAETMTRELALTTSAGLSVDAE